MTARGFAIIVLQLGSTLSIVAGIIVPVYALAESYPRDSTLRTILCFVFPAQALFSWAVLYALAALLGDRKD